MITAVLKFEINNTFDEWEKGFYSHQSTARKAGLFEIYHGHSPDNERKICVVLNALSDAHMQKFMANNCCISIVTADQRKSNLRAPLKNSNFCFIRNSIWG